MCGSRPLTSSGSDTIKDPGTVTGVVWKRGKRKRPTKPSKKTCTKAGSRNWDETATQRAEKPQTVSGPSNETKRKGIENAKKKEEMEVFGGASLPFTCPREGETKPVMRGDVKKCEGGGQPIHGGLEMRCGNEEVQFSRFRERPEPYWKEKEKMTKGGGEKKW